jgi:hypothetical protein
VEALVLSCCFDQLIQCRIDQRAQVIYVKSISDTRDVPDSKVESLVESLKAWEKDSLSQALASFETKCAEMNKSVLETH